MKNNLPENMFDFIFCEDLISASPINIKSKHGFVRLLYKCAIEFVNTKISSVSLKKYVCIYQKWYNVNNRI